MRTLTLLACFMLSSLGSAALAGDPAAEALEGTWVVSVGEQPRDRFLIVRGAKTEKNEVRVQSAVYGWIDGKGKQVGDWKAEIFGDRIKLAFVTPADSLVTLNLSSTDTSVSGEMKTKAGKNYEVRMTRLDEEELAAMRAAAAGAKAEQSKERVVSKNSKISLVYVGANDCPSCRSFHGQIVDDGKRLKQRMPEIAEARVVHVQLFAYVAPVTEALLPDDMKWLVRPNAAGKAPLRKRGTPFFAAVVDQRVIAQGHGLAALETLVAPAIQRATEQRRAAN